MGDGELPRLLRLSDAEWQCQLALAAQMLPFAASPWQMLGLAERPDMHPVPLLMQTAHLGSLLVPLFRSTSALQIGCFGYGMVYPAADWRGDRLPDFDVIASVVTTKIGVDRLRTLLPPPGVVAALDHLTGHWPSLPWRSTFILDLAGGSAAVWARARGSARTAVRRAARLGLHARPAAVADSVAVARLYQTTMARNRVSTSLCETHFRALLGADGGAVTATVAEDSAGVQAAAFFALQGAAAYHVFQVVSVIGRRTNAGQLAFWTALAALAECDVSVVDLGSAAGDGQEWFKTSWGGQARPTRRIEWPR